VTATAPKLATASGYDELRCRAHHEARNACRQRLAKHLWQAGARPVLEALLEVDAGRPLDEVLERFGRIPARIYRTLGADVLTIDIPVPVSAITVITVDMSAKGGER
jgi:hypothetical protein